jgi:hypothetical protein
MRGKGFHARQGFLPSNLLIVVTQSRYFLIAHHIHILYKNCAGFNSIMNFMATVRILPPFTKPVLLYKLWAQYTVDRDNKYYMFFRLD